MENIETKTPKDYLGKKVYMFDEVTKKYKEGYSTVDGVIYTGKRFTLERLLKRNERRN